jgi:hypothetical protein
MVTERFVMMTANCIGPSHKKRALDDKFEWVLDFAVVIVVLIAMTQIFCRA